MNELRLLKIDADLWRQADRAGAIRSVGGKTIGLSALHAANLNVPAATVLPTDAYNQNVRESNILASFHIGANPDRGILQAMARTVSSVRLDDKTLVSIQHGIAWLKSPLVIRSSAVVEDSRTASWAGQFRTILGVSHAAAPQSILRCWASIFSPSTAYYSQYSGVELREVAMAVVIQEMVDSVWAGVAFGGMNVNMEADETGIVIEAVRGQGEQLVSGSKNPELRAELALATGALREKLLTLDARRGRRLISSQIIPDEVFAQLASGVRALAVLFETTRLDIEWAWDGRTLWFLQVRSIVFPN